MFCTVKTKNSYVEFKDDVSGQFNIKAAIIYAAIIIFVLKSFFCLYYYM